MSREKLKCPKCGGVHIQFTIGSETDYTTLHCFSCGYTENFQQSETQPEPSTAEMLLWLVENRKFPIIFNTVNCFAICAIPNDRYYFYGNASDEYKTFSDAISAAYKWAKEQK